MDVFSSRVGAAERVLVLTLAALCTILSPSFADAQTCPAGDFFCEEDTVAWSASSSLFDEIGFDTGYIPGGSPLQIRVFFNVNAESNVSMNGSLRATWPSPLTARIFAGDPGSANLNMDYGIEVGLQFRWDILGFDGTINIPIPGIPSDLALIDSTDFDPLLLPGDSGRPVDVMDTTGRFNVVEVNVLGAIVPIPGLEGNLGLDIEAILSVAWQTNDILIDGGSAVTNEIDGVLVGPATFGGFGASRDIPVQPRGRLDITGRVDLIPTLTFKIIGFELGSFDLGTAGIQLFNDSSALSLSEDVAHIPLPDLAQAGGVSATTIAFGEVFLGTQVAEEIVITNSGESDLWVDFSGFPQPFGVDPQMVVIAPGQSETVELFFIATELGRAGAFAIARTNDPDRPEVLFRPSATVVEPPMMDMGTPMADAGMDADAGVPMDGAVPTMDGSVPLVDGSVPITPDFGPDGPPTGGLSGGACGCRITASDENGDAVPMAFALLMLGFVGWRRRRG